jgi:hypothetical protein
VVCGQECSSDNQLHLQLQWHPRWIYVFIVISLWIYLIAGAITRRRASIEVFLCDEHMARRRNGNRILLGSVLVGMVVLLGGLSMEYFAFAGVGGVLLLGGVVVGLTMSRTVRVIRIEGDELWLVPGAGFMETVA